MYSNFFLLAVLAILTECWAACPQNSCNFPPVSEEIVNLGRCVPAYYGSTGISGKYEPLEGPVSWIVGGLSEVPANFPESLILDTKNLVFQYGSYDIFGYHHNSREWISKEFPRLNTPRGLAIAEEYDGSIYVWGGGGGLEKCDIYGKKNTCEVITSNFNETRFAATSEIVGDKLFIFGGILPDGQLAHSLLIYDFKNNTWSRSNASTVPSERIGASLDQWGEGLLLFGGYSVEDDKYLNDLWLYFYEDDTWIFANITETTTAGRAFHWSFVEDERLVYGLGLAESDNWRTISILDIDGFEWTNVQKSRSQAVPPVQMGFAYTYQDDQVLIFGGVRETELLDHQHDISSDIWRLDTKTVKWEGRDCYGCYVYDEPSFHCVEPSDSECELCENCGNSIHRKRYVSNLKNKILKSDWSGALRQCPAYWRESIYTGIHTWPNQPV